MIVMIMAVVLLLTCSCVSSKQPSDLKTWHVGQEGDVVATPCGGLVLIGGGRDPDEAFLWFNQQAAGGDIVVLRASRSDGYNSYLYNEIGAVDSVRTILVDSRKLAGHPWVIRQVDQAEGIFLAGGDQAAYVALWADTPLSSAISRAHERGSVLGGTSAGAMVLGSVVFDASGGSVSSKRSLDNPYTAAVHLSPALFKIPMLQDVIVDTHFDRRDRVGRLLVFMARALEDDLCTDISGLGIDESTAVCILPSGQSYVVGQGGMTLLSAHNAPDICRSDQPLTFSNVLMWQVEPEVGQIDWPPNSSLPATGSATVDRGHVQLHSDK